MQSRRFAMSWVFEQLSSANSRWVTQLQSDRKKLSHAGFKGENSLVLKVWNLAAVLRNSCIICLIEVSSSAILAKQMWKNQEIFFCKLSYVQNTWAQHQVTWAKMAKTYPSYDITREKPEN